MANQVLGRNFLFQMLVGVTYYNLFCGKTAELTTNQDEIEVTHVNSGNDREYVPGMSNHTVSISGVTVLDNTENRISWEYLAQIAQRRSINTYRILLTDQDATQRSITFDAFWTTGTLAKDIVSWSQSSVTMRITGALTYGNPVTPPDPPACSIEDPIYTTLLSTETSITSALLIPDTGETITILMVSRSGAVHYETVGTPGSLEFKYDSTTGTISFDPLNPGNLGGEPITVEYKIET